MEVKLLKPIGFCIGVVEAINKAKLIKKEYPDNKVYVFGYLVHNESVIHSLLEQDIISIDITNKDPFEILESFKKDDIVIFSAHGHNEKYEEILKRKGITYFDTTCSKVKRNMDLIREHLEEGVIYIGKKFHPETVASLSIDERVHLYDIKDGFDFSSFNYSRPLVVNQTTLSFLEIEDIHKDILKHIPNANIIDEICDATRSRQEALKNLDATYDLIIVVGSTKSSNTDKLYQVAKELHSNALCLKVNSLEELKEYDLSKFTNAVITSGTSTPIKNIIEIEKYLKEK